MWMIVLRTVFIYLVLMLRYSPLLTMIGLVSVLMNLVIARYMSEKRVKCSHR